MAEQRDLRKPAEVKWNPGVIDTRWLEESREHSEEVRRQVEHTARFLSDLRGRLGHRLDRSFGKQQM
jgi:hypothetical protein